MIKLRMYVPCTTINRSQDMVGRNCIRVPIIGIELAIDPSPPGGILKTMIS